MNTISSLRQSAFQRLVGTSGGQHGAGTPGATLLRAGGRAPAAGRRLRGVPRRQREAHLQRGQDCGATGTIQYMAHTSQSVHSYSLFTL